MNNSKYWTALDGNKIPSSIKIDSSIQRFIKKNDKIIDIGCGSGKTILTLHKKGYLNIHGIDVNKNAIKAAQAKCNKQNNKLKNILKVGNVTRLPYNNSTFDCAITQAFWTTITTKTTRSKAIKEISRILKKNGTLYIADFKKNNHLKIYKERYKKGLQNGHENGTFEVINKKSKKIEYLAHHYTKKELFDFIKLGGFSRIDYYEDKLFNTKSGNQIYGFILIVSKN